MSWWAGSGGDPETAARLARIERRLKAIMDHLEIEDVEPTYPEVARHLREGRTIQAIKVYREQTGVGLAQAKRDVEAMPEYRP